MLVRQPYLYRLQVPISLRTGLLQKKPFSRETIISRHPIGSLNASVSGLIVSVYTSIGEPALPYFTSEDAALTPQFWETLRSFPINLT